ncbi:MAG: alpha/beta fold hydrolase [Pyrinomonadaceae bacterium]
MYKSKTLFSAVLLAVCLTLLSNNVRAWERTISYCDTCGGDARHVVVDAAGDVIAVGTVNEKEVVKMSKADGSVIWRSIVSNDPIGDLAIDSNGDVFVVFAWSRSVVKVSGATGTRMWQGLVGQTNFNGYQPIIHAVAVDRDNNVVTAGQVGGLFNVGKLRGTDGTEMWRYERGGPTYDVAYDVAIDTNGNVAAAGQMNKNFVAVRLNGTNGSEIWQREINGTGNLSNVGDYDVANAVAVDSGGNVVVAGVTSNASGGPTDFTVAKYSLDGTRLWMRTIDGTSHWQDIANAVVVDRDDNVIAAGSFQDANSFGSVEHFHVIKFSGTTGNNLWSKPAQDVPFNGAEISGRAFALSVNAYGNIVAAGKHNGRFTAVKFWGSSGGRPWLYSSTTPVPGNGNNAHDVVMDRNSDVIVAGEVIPTSNGWNKFTVVKLKRKDGLGYDDPPPPPFPTPDPTLTPVIFIPGTAGSRLNTPGILGTLELWLGLAGPHDSLGLDPDTDPCPNYAAPFACYRPNVDVAGVLISDIPTIPSYGKILDMFRSKGYTDVGARPTLFPFAYDWRKSNFDNTDELKKLVTRIRSIYPNTKVNIVTHSMGSLLARRYIIENPSPDSHHVDKLITIAAPWLGAPKAILAMETGEFVSGPIPKKSTIKKLVEFFPSVHELLPSKIYFDVADKGGNPFRDKPFRENGWNVNGNKDSYEFYTYNQLYDFLNGAAGDVNERLLRSLPYRRNELFHNWRDYTDQPIQDDWRGKGFGVSYYHIYGWKDHSNTIVQVVAKWEARCFSSRSRACVEKAYRKFDVKLGPGDGTVPVLSAARRGQGYDYNEENAKILPVFGPETDHFGLTVNPYVHQNVITYLNSPPQSLTEELNEKDNTNELNQMVEPVTQQAYYLEVGGATSATLTDEAGNLTYPIGDVPNAGVPNAGVPEVTSYLLGEDTFLSIMPIDDSYTLTFVTGNSPVAIDLTKGTHIETAQAIRYLDLDLPANTKVQLVITPEGVGELRYDSNGDGTFDTPITPTVSVTGQAAQDTDAPVVTIAEVIQSPTSRRVTITATDDGSGVRSLFYSLNGTNFQPYVEPLNLNPAQTPVVYAFAEDNVANRSGLVTYNLASNTYEADISPRGNGNGAVTSTDVSIIQGFQLGFGLPYQSNEFQRADCAPFDSRGDGRISSVDVSQAQAYQLGFNLALDGTLQAAAGPIAPAGGASTFESDTVTNYGETNQANVQSDVQSPREVRVVNSSAGIGQTITVPIEVDAVGDESVYGFSLSYDSTKLSNPVVSIGTAGGSVSSNTTQAGRIGISVTFGGRTIAAGNNRHLINVQFTVAANAQAETLPLVFTEAPTFKEVAGDASNPSGVVSLPTSFTGGSLTINQPTNKSRKRARVF